MILVDQTVSPDAAFGLLLYLSLFVATFAHEGAAIAAGAVLMIQQQASPLLTALCLVAGVVAGDIAIYGLGALARRSEWLRRRFDVEARVKTQRWFDTHLLAVVAVCRVVPGVLFPTFLSYGWCGVPFRRFAATTLIVSAVYVPAVLFLLVQFGLQARGLFQHWSWLALIVAVMALTAFAARRLWTRANAMARLPLA